MSEGNKIEIRNRWTGSVLFAFSREDNTLGQTIKEATMRGANLREANLIGANLRGANLYRANLREANLREANLREADLSSVDLREADLREANLREANLLEANLLEADLYGAQGAYLACPSEGSFVGWKKAGGFVLKLQIPADARRSSAGGNKCRCDKALVLEIQRPDGTPADVRVVASDRDVDFRYLAGALVEAAAFDDNRWNECAAGIHFFIDRRAAVEY